MVQYVHQLRKEIDDKRPLIDTWLQCSNIQQAVTTWYHQSTNTAQLDSPTDILLRRLVEPAISQNEFSNDVITRIRRLITRIRRRFVTEVIEPEVDETEVDESEIIIITICD